MSDTSKNEPAVTVRPQKGSALARLAAAARAQNVRGGLSELVHGWAARHENETVKAANPQPDVAAFD